MKSVLHLFSLGHRVSHPPDRPAGHRPLRVDRPRVRRGPRPGLRPPDGHRRAEAVLQADPPLLQLAGNGEGPGARAVRAQDGEIICNIFICLAILSKSVSLFNSLFFLEIYKGDFGAFAAFKGIRLLGLGKKNR